MISKDVKNYIDKSVLCWLATCNKELIPNVSPKEIFTCINDTSLLIANIASHNSIKNIQENPNVCVSFVDIFVQKGYKLKGVATIIDSQDPDFALKLKHVTDLFTDKFPIQSVIEIEITQVDRIEAPSYFLFPNTTEESQVLGAMKTYNVQKA